MEHLEKDLGRSQASTKGMVMSKDKKFDRFELEQGIMQCWNMIDDVKLLVKRGAPVEDFEGVSRLYQHKFEELFAQFENGVSEGKIK
jgi:hypothetical protein